MHHSTITPPQSSPASGNYWAARSPQMNANRLPAHHARPVSQHINFTEVSPGAGAGERGYNDASAFSDHIRGSGIGPLTRAESPHHRMNNIPHGTAGPLSRAESSSPASHHHRFNNVPYERVDSVPPMRRDSLLKLVHYSSSQPQQTTPTQSSNGISKRPLDDLDSSVPLSFPSSQPPNTSGGGRGSNFNKPSLEQLCKSWLNVSEDALVGTDQKGSTFWVKITDDFNSRVPPANQRTLKSLSSRWSILNAAMAKFAGCYQQVQMLRETGKCAADQVVDALVMYQADVGSEFKDMACYNIVKNSPKWKTNSTVLDHCGTGGVDEDFVMPHVLAGLGSGSPSSSGSPSTTSTSISATDISGLPLMDRPEGNKKAKRNRNSKVEDVHPQFITNQAAGLRVTERIAEQGERQTVALERMFELSVLMTDTSKVDERTRAGIEAAKEMINRKHEAQRGV